MPSIEEGTGILDATRVRKYRDVKGGYSKFAESDVVIAKITPCMENGKVAIAKSLKNGIGCGTTELHVFRPVIRETNRYLLYFLLQKSVREVAKQSFQGTSGHLRVPVDFFDEVDFPIPPFAEQRRIVTKLETLLGRVDASRRRLVKIPIILKCFRQAVLAAACSGRLTADWRSKNPTYSDSLQGSVLPVDPLEDWGELPEQWCYSRVVNMIDSLKYGTSKKCDYSKAGHPVLRIPNINDHGKINSVDLKYADLPTGEVDQLRLKENDILLIRSNGSVPLVGKSAIVRKSEEGFAYAGYLIRLRTNPKKVHAPYLNLALGCTFVRDQIEIPIRSTSGVNNINSYEVQQLVIPYPRVPEQHEIVRRVEVLFGVADQIEARYTKAKAHVDRLTQSILAKAFRGELVRQDPNDEPASVLLEKIRAQRAVARTNTRREFSRLRKRVAQSGQPRSHRV